MSKNSIEIRQQIELPYADDPMLYDACEVGAVEWDMLELAGYCNENPSPEAVRLRGIVYLMRTEKLDRYTAEEHYDELVAAKEADEKRTILTLEERARKLYAEGLLYKDELELFISEDDDKGYVASLMEALLGGADRKEADRFAKLAKRNGDKWSARLDNPHLPSPTTEETNQVRRMHFRYKGMSDDEIDQLFGYESQKPVEIPQWLAFRKLGVPLRMAERFQDLVDRAKSEGLESNEDLERRAYINLRSVLTQAGQNPETRLALKDFGIERMFEYIVLQIGTDLVHDSIESIFRSGGIPLHNVQTARDVVALGGLTDQAEIIKENLRQALENEPMLSHFTIQYRDALMQALDGGRFGLNPGNQHPATELRELG